eukprot:snap_masked-scaffold_4-processed-gene-20.29-mRNA-1 protein AED:1.00 eAED:1.00 QI:0/-1/0/0/-1/1/1/0/207
MNLFNSLSGKLGRVSYIRFIPNTSFSWNEFSSALIEDEDFRNQFTIQLTSNDFPAFFFETIPFSPDEAENTQFEFVLVKSQTLSKRNQDNRPFEEKFAQLNPNTFSTSFWNLGKDAELVVPLPQTNEQGRYTHLANFLRMGTSEEINNFWKTVGNTIQKRIQEKQSDPLWVSTSGLGVSYLHLRLDSYPKYYQFKEYIEYPSDKHIS